MLSPADMKERHQAGLAELAEMGLSLARHLHGRALAAEDEKTAAELSLAFQRVSRSVRQTYALESRLEREHRLAAKEIDTEVRMARLARVQRKRRQVREAVSALIWTEYESEDAETLCEAVGSLVWNHAADDEDAFLETPLDDCVARIRADLGLPDANDAPPDGEPPQAEILLRRSG